MEIFMYEKQNDKVYMEDIVKECYQNLNKWENIID